MARHRMTPFRLVFVFCCLALLFVLQLLAISDIERTSDTQKNEFLISLRGPVSQDDPRLIDWVASQIDSPSSEPYSLHSVLGGLSYDLNQTSSPSQDFIYEAIYDVFHDMDSRGLFFVEAGAYDGEFLSNTLFLEKDAGWQGLLVEPGKKAYQKLLSKHRKAFSINACLSTEPYPSQKYFAQVEDTGKRNYNAENLKTGSQKAETDRVIAEHTGKASSRLVEFVNHSDPSLEAVGQYPVQCLPLYSLVRALGVTHIHLLSLDVEGAQMGILRTIPWDRIQITMLVVEHLGDPEELIGFLRDKGYGLFRAQYPDYIFLRNEDVIEGVY